MQVNSSPLLELRDLTKRFGDFAAVDRLTLDVASGEFLTLLGASGSGKTTTLRMIAGFEVPTAGEILMAGRRSRTSLRTSGTSTPSSSITRSSPT